MCFVGQRVYLEYWENLYEVNFRNINEKYSDVMAICSLLCKFQYMSRLLTFTVTTMEALCKKKTKKFFNWT